MSIINERADRVRHRYEGDNQGGGRDALPTAPHRWNELARREQEAADYVSGRVLLSAADRAEIARRRARLGLPP